MPAMFSMHMAAHMLLSMMVPVLLVLGAPVTLALRALPAAGPAGPPGPREWLLAALHSRVSRFLTNPIVATVIFVAGFYGLYFGGIFDLAVGSHAAHVAMNLHFLLSGYLFYWVVIGVDPTPRPIPPIAKLAVVFASLPLHAFFGVVLMGTKSVLAGDFYQSLHLAWHDDLLGDQRLGGGIAWSAGEVPLVLVLLALLVQWRRSDQRDLDASGPGRRARRGRRPQRLQRHAQQAGGHGGPLAGWPGVLLPTRFWRSEEAFGVVVGVGAGLAGVEFWGWDPLHALGCDGDGPAVFGEAVVGWAGQDFFVDVGVAVVFDPALGVVDLGAVGGDGAAGFGAAAVSCVEDDAVCGWGEAFGASAVEDLVGVAVEDGEVVVGVGGHADEVAHGDEGAAGGDGGLGGRRAR